MCAPSLTSLGLAMATTLLLSTAGCDARPAVGSMVNATSDAVSSEPGHSATSGFAAALSTAAQLATQSATQAVMSAMGRTVNAPAPDDRGLPPPRSPANASIIHRHARELGDMSGWSDGRCTWYGGPGGPGPDGACGACTDILGRLALTLPLMGAHSLPGMNIYTGSCGYKNKLPHNDFIAAAQTMGGYDWGLTGDCGKCYEVLCVPGRTRGLPNSVLGPWEGCLDPGRRSVVVMISDSCPCHHPNVGNKRWCCGDERHMDLSYSAFDAIAQRDKGVVDLKIRPVSCDLAGQTIYYSSGTAGVTPQSQG